jgi:hypothetical protein
VNLAVAFWVAQFPHIPPPADAPLTRLAPARFWRLVARVKTAMLRHYAHPLFFELATAAQPMRVARGGTMAEIWRALNSGVDVPLAPPNLNAPVFGAILSSMGNVRAPLRLWRAEEF